MSWLLAFAGFAALIILHEFGHFIAAKAVGMRVERFFLFFPPKLVSVKRGETEYGIGAIPLGGFVKITGMNPDEVHPPEPEPGQEGRATHVEPLPPELVERAYYNQPVWKRIVVIGAGPAMNLLVAFVLLFFLAFGVQEPTHEVSEVQADSAAAGKLQPGDEIVAVDGVRGDTAELREAVAKHECAGEPTDGCKATTPAQVRIIRDGEPLTLSIRPTFDAEADQPLLGFVYGTRPLDPSAGESARIAGDFMWTVTTQTVTVIARVFDPEQREQISGVVGSYEVTRQAIEFDSRRALTLIAVISLSLAVINLFPFLPLDGGHIFWSLVEKVRGKPVPFSVMERAGVVGFALVMVLFVIGLSNDIGRLSGDGFNAP